MSIRNDRDFYGDRIVNQLNSMGIVRACRLLEELRQAGIPQDVKHIFKAENEYMDFLSTCYRCSRHAI